MESLNAIKDEEEKMRRLRLIVDFTAVVLAQEKMSINEALDLINATKRTVLRLFPDKDNTYDIIYGRRFAGILKERLASTDPEENRSERIK